MVIQPGIYTFAMIKPDATSSVAGHKRKDSSTSRFGENHIVKKDHGGSVMGQILHMIEGADFEVVAYKMVVLTLEMMNVFYGIHRDKSFFEEMTKEMVGGKVGVMVLKKENAVHDFRKLIGSTDPDKAEVGTIRHAIGLDVGRNSIHGSDSDENAAKEIDFFFAQYELI